MNTIINYINNIIIKNNNNIDNLNIKQRDIYKSFNSIYIRKYEFVLQRLYKYEYITDDILLCALIYLEKVINKYSININRMNIYKILCTFIIISIKFNNDTKISLSKFSNFCNILGSLTRLEKLLLELLDYQLYINNHDFIVFKENVFKN
jgi:hypothetical protein